MKKIFAILLILLSAGTGFFAQTNINADCINAIPLCSTPNFTFNATSGVGSVTDIPTGNTISNPNINPASPNSGCLLAGELKPQWLLITVGNAGNLEFIFGAGNSSNPQVGFYDWAMWPYTPTTCSGIQNNTLPPIRCNWNASSSGGTGIASASNQPPSSSSGNFEPPLAVQPCQQFIICISNYSGVNTLVSFQSLGTASLSCNPNCLSVNNPVLCAGATTSIIASSSGLVSNVTYSINPGGAASSNPTFVITPSVSAAYTVYATGVNSSSTTVTQTAVSNVTVNPSLVTAPTVTQAGCTTPTNAFNLGLSFYPASSNPNYTVTWNNTPNGVTSPTQTSGTGTILPGVYTATITTAGGCNTVTSFTINNAPAPASISLIPFGPGYTITCFHPTITVNTTDAAYNYTWNSTAHGTIAGQTADFDYTKTGTWTVTAVNPVSGCVTTKTISVGINTVVPTSVVSPSFQNINCAINSVTSITATASPVINVSHHIVSPLGGSFTANSYSVVYTPFAPGTYTHCVVNDINGCSVCDQFSVTSSSGFPTFTITSPQNFTLGCSSKSVANVQISGGQTTPPGGSLVYAFLPPGSPTTAVNYVVGNASVIAVPGTWTFVTKDINNSCETRIPVSILLNNQGPSIDTVFIPTKILDCTTTSVVLEAHSETPNTSYNWGFPTPPGNLQSATITVNTNTLAPTSTLIANYSLTLTDNNNLCISTTVIPMFQNLYKPVPKMVSGLPTGISCKTNTITLTSQSSSGIPPNTTLPHPYPVIAYLWEGPTPLDPLQKSSTYVASLPGDYTLTAMDLSNGCTSSTVLNVPDNRKIPLVGSPVSSFSIDCGSATTTISPTYSGTPTDLSYSWTPVLGAATSPPDKATLITDKTGIYRIKVTNTVNGCYATADVSVTLGVLTPSVRPNTNSGYAPLAVSFYNFSESSTGSGNIKSVWNFGNGTYSVTNSTGEIPLCRYTQPGNYNVTVFVTKGLCIDTVKMSIDVDVPSAVEIPNLFTPNGDGVNDVFFLKAANLTEINIRIYDRWGNLVYYTKTENGNIAWDGKNYSGKDVAEGVYYYTLKASGKDGNSFEKKGNVTVAR